MSISVSPALRNVLTLDAAMSVGAGLLCAAASGYLSGLLALPQLLLFWAGIILLPWAAFLYLTARRVEVARLVMLDIVAVNVLWTIASVGILIMGLVVPNALGTAFIIVQAVAVGVLAVLQLFLSRAEARLPA